MNLVPMDFVIKMVNYKFKKEFNYCFKLEILFKNGQLGSAQQMEQVGVVHSHVIRQTVVSSYSEILLLYL